ncbi:M48 family metalloprotease [Roseovarius phycicola]|uniref:M48 family metalloprotease n=1 Tax=Roseovarius phycicola TaxID=3080976 RepID=A0ABZ2HGF8_9RHOB
MSLSHILRILTASALLAMLLVLPARAQTILRDPDIEHALKQLAAPVLRAAGLGTAGMRILVIDDGSLNAFVIDRNHIFLNSGLIQRMETPDMLQSVIAHEAAHITNGHLTRRPINLRNARTAAGIGSALAAIAAIAAGGGGEAASAAALGAQNTAQRLFFVHTRAEENAADQSGLRYLVDAGISTDGALKVLDLFRGQELLSRRRQDPYARTHPLSQDRYRTVQRLSQAYSGRDTPKDTAAWYWFMRAKGKLSAFQRSPKWTLNRAGESGYADIKAMREAVAWHRRSNLKRALPLIDKAIAANPNDPYYYELKGQILMESRQFDAAASAYGRAAKLAPRNALIQGSFGRALLATGQTKKALQLLEKSRASDGRDPRLLRDMATAYAKLGNAGMASVVTAERYAMVNRLEDAAIHATRATGLLPQGSAGYRRAQDILSAAKRAARNK